MANKDPKRNPSGCLDLTAYKAIENVEKETEEELERFRKLLRAIFDICELSDLPTIIIVEYSISKFRNAFCIRLRPVVIH